MILFFTDKKIVNFKNITEIFIIDNHIKYELTNGEMEILFIAKDAEAALRVLDILQNRIQYGQRFIDMSAYEEWKL